MTPDSQDPDWLRTTGRALGLSIIIGSLLLAASIARDNFRRPRTEDATVRANVVVIAPNVSGPIIELNVVDNQEVAEGAVLFAIDRSPFQVEFDRAKASLALTKSEVEALQLAVTAADAEVKRLEEASAYALDHAKRLKPLLAKQFVTQDKFEEAQTAARSAVIAVDRAREEVARQKALFGAEGEANAHLKVAEAAVRAAELNLGYCTVRAPFPCRVTNLNISKGEYAKEGVPVFALVDTRAWYVIANFEETYIASIHPGMSADVYLMGYPNRRFHGTVQGIGWAVLSQDSTTVAGLPAVRQTLNWVRLAQRIPVRIQLDAPDPVMPYRMGMSATVTLRAAP